MPCQTRKVFFDSFSFHVWEGVYEPAEDSFLFAENLAGEEGRHVLDMGTGCGILGIAVAPRATEVIAVDVNPYAVRCAKENAEMNGVAKKMLFIQGDLFTPLRTKQEFDLMLFNAPYLPVPQKKSASWIEWAWTGGATGRQVINSFINRSPKYLKRGGRILLLQSTLSSVDDTLLGFSRHGLKTEIVAKRDLPFLETIVLIQAFE